MAQDAPPADHAPGETAVRPYTGHVFLAALALTALVVVAAGWFTDIRHAAHASLLAVAVVALLPLIIVAAFLLLALVGAILGAMGGDGGAELIITGGEEFVVPYYRFLARRRHPVFWGVGLGVLAGGLVLLALIAGVIVPGETKTATALARAQEQLETHYKQKGSFPKPGPQGHLPRSTFDAAAQGPLTDGFGRPLQYQLKGAWKLASWTLRSDGFDAAPNTADDLCVSGSTKLARAADLVGGGVNLIRRLATGEKASTTDRLEGIRALRCRASGAD